MGLYFAYVISNNTNKILDLLLYTLLLLRLRIRHLVVGGRPRQFTLPPTTLRGIRLKKSFVITATTS